MRPSETSDTAMTTQTTTTMRQRAAEKKHALLGFHYGVHIAPREPLTTMLAVCLGGPMDGEYRDIPNRTTEQLSFGLHRRGFTLIDTYRRTIQICPVSQRTIFEHAGQTRIDTPAPSAISQVLGRLGFLKPRRTVVG